jgi:hypothetical protein
MLTRRKQNTTANSQAEALHGLPGQGAPRRASAAGTPRPAMTTPRIVLAMRFPPSSPPGLTRWSMPTARKQSTTANSQTEALHGLPGQGAPRRASTEGNPRPAMTTQRIVLAARFFAPESWQATARKLSPQKDGRRSAERRRGRYRGPANKCCHLSAVIAALPPPSPSPASGGGNGRGQLAFRRSTAALAKASRLRLSPVPRFMATDNRSAARATSSW